jgi:catechol 2,3-dioxygenase-like lactoylglutathione lyase family enzyme
MLAWVSMLAQFTLQGRTLPPNRLLLCQSGLEIRPIQAVYEKAFLFRAREWFDNRIRRAQNSDMALQRMDNVLIVVDDLQAVKAFFIELGMELEGETTVEGPWVDSTVGLSGVHADITMMRTPDGHGRVELTKFHTPPAVKMQPENAPANALGIRRIMFAVEGIDDTVARLRTHGADLLGEIAQYEDMYRLCFMRGPEGIIVGLAEELANRSVTDA